MPQLRDISSRLRPRGDALARASRRAARACAALMVAALLSGCAWFSPDAGMGVVANIAEHELSKDVAAIRSDRKSVV